MQRATVRFVFETTGKLNSLLDFAASVSVCLQSEGQNPLHGAAMHGHLEVVKLLVKSGMDTMQATVRFMLRLCLQHEGAHSVRVLMFLSES